MGRFVDESNSLKALRRLANETDELADLSCVLQDFVDVEDSVRSSSQRGDGSCCGKRTAGKSG